MQGYVHRSDIHLHHSHTLKAVTFGLTNKTPKPLFLKAHENHTLASPPRISLCEHFPFKLQRERTSTPTCVSRESQRKR